MISRLLELKPNNSYFLFGPRGTGKTQWLKDNYKDSLYIDLLDFSIYNKLLAHPDHLDDLIPHDYSGYIIIDEVQKIPELLNVVHRLIESKKWYFILTGSSARKLRKQGVNLLAGRALTKYMFPLTCLELGDQFDLETSLKTGHLPSLYDKEKTELPPNEYLGAYIQTYLKEEIQEEGLTRNIGNFARFLETASFSQGEVLNMSSVAREANINRKVAESYFEILEDLLIAKRVPAFQKRAQRRIVQHPKFYFFDTGVYRAIRPKGPLDSPEEIDGAALETLFFQELSAFISYNQLDLSIYYWRTSNNQEVDFIVYGECGFFAIEIKRKKQFRRSDLKGLKLFKKDYPSATCIMLYGGKDHLYPDDISVIPAEQFLRKPKQFLLVS